MTELSNFDESGDFPRLTVAKTKKKKKSLGRKFIKRILGASEKKKLLWKETMFEKRMRNKTESELVIPRMIDDE